jgi:hypothetical protein
LLGGALVSSGGIVSFIGSSLEINNDLNQGKQGQGFGKLAIMVVSRRSGNYIQKIYEMEKLTPSARAVYEAAGKGTSNGAEIILEANLEKK